MLSATKTSFFLDNYLLEESGLPVCEIKMSIWSENAVINIDDKEAKFHKRGVINNEYLLDYNGQTLASASGRSLFKSEFFITLKDKHLSLTPQNWLSMNFVIRQDDQTVGSIYRKGIFLQKRYADLPVDWPLVLKAFIFTLVLTAWKNSDAAAG